MPYDGGYLMAGEGLIRTGIHTHTSALEQPFSEATLSALNRVQRTPWRINKWVLSVMKGAYQSGVGIGGLPNADLTEVPRKSTEEWDSLSEDERRDWKFQLSGIHGSNARTAGRRFGFLSQLNVAQEMADRPAIWFPHFLDFRGRFYPMPQGLHPQCDDIGKSLLEFAEGKPLGERGEYWLAVRLANTFGMDKLPLDERVQWVNDHSCAIYDSADYPLDGERFWTEAEEPWSFLATCKEWSDLSMGGYYNGGADFVSHLPVQLDGSCNGLQHLSAMGRDPIGARATNVAANVERQDIYTEVARVVERLVSEDAVGGNELAHLWVGKVARKVVKRAVMTTPYGVTSRGIAEQLMADGHTDGMDQKSKAASYLRDKITLALDETVVSAKSIMGWLQDVAVNLSRADIPFSFVTPTGNTVQQSYYTLNIQRLVTVSGALALWSENKRGGLQDRKQMLAAAPNFIHAFDASHQTLTINSVANRLPGERTSFSVIHDSFGTHACDVDCLSRTLRETFVSIYQQDWLQVTEDLVRSYAGPVQIPSYRDYLTPGDFDVREVLNSEFFFA